VRKTDDQPSDTWFAELMEAAVLAGRWRETAGAVPEARAQLERAADRKSAAATALLQQNFSAHGGITLTVGAFTSPGGLSGADDAN
jgi:hypothetical protein